MGRVYWAIPATHSVFTGVKPMCHSATSAAAAGLDRRFFTTSHPAPGLLWFGSLVLDSKKYLGNVAIQLNVKSYLWIGGLNPTAKQRFLLQHRNWKEVKRWSRQCEWWVTFAVYAHYIKSGQILLGAPLSPIWNGVSLRIKKNIHTSPDQWIVVVLVLKYLQII